MGPMAKNARATGADGHSPNADGTRRKNQRSIFKNVPADGHHGCQLEETKTSVRRRFLGSSSDKVSACLCTPNGRAGDKEQ